MIAYKSGGKDRVDRVFAAGRNESGQLAIGYNSQEGTRNLVQGFKGDGIIQAACSLQSSYLLLKNHGTLPSPPLRLSVAGLVID